MDAYLLVSHGSRDPRPQMAISKLAAQLQLDLASVAGTSPILVGTAQLELAAQPLHIQISDFADKCAQIGIAQMSILPLFLIPGVHVIEDIPAEVEIARENTNGMVSLELEPFLGSSSIFVNLFIQNSLSATSQAIILAHGSRRKDGNAIVEALANRLEAKVAYWSIAPSLVDTVTELIATGATEIDILHYFLFAGGITDAIERLVEQLQTQFPQVQLTLAPPIGNSPELVSTIGKILTENRS